MHFPSPPLPTASSTLVTHFLFLPIFYPFSPFTLETPKAQPPLTQQGPTQLDHFIIAFPTFQIPSVKSLHQPLYRLSSIKCHVFMWGACCGFPYLVSSHFPEKALSSSFFPRPPRGGPAPCSHIELRSLKGIFPLASSHSPQ